MKLLLKTYQRLIRLIQIPGNCGWDVAWGKWYNGTGGYTPSTALMFGNKTSSWMSGSAVNQYNTVSMNNQPWANGSDIKIKIPTNGPSKYNVINSGSTSLEAYTLMIAPEGIRFFNGYYNGSTNCARSMRIIIYVKNGPSQNLSDLYGCDGESHVVGLNSNYTYSGWTPPLLNGNSTPTSTILTPTTTTPYSGTVTDVQGCSVTDGFTILVNNLDVDLIQDQVICAGNLPYIVNISYNVDYKITVNGSIVLDIANGVFPTPSGQFVINTVGMHTISYEYKDDPLNINNNTICTKEYTLNVTDLGNGSEYFGCNREYPTICPIGANANTTWAYNVGVAMVIVHTGACYTPTQPGNYVIVNNTQDCYATANITVIDTCTPCNADFRMLINSLGNGSSLSSAVIQIADPNVSITYIELFQNGTLMYSGLPQSYVLPSGSYKLCIVAQNNKTGQECKSCQEFCIGTGMVEESEWKGMERANEWRRSNMESSIDTKKQTDVMPVEFEHEQLAKDLKPIITPKPIRWYICYFITEYRD